MTIETYDIEIKQGSYWSISVILKNDDETIIDLTGYSAKMQIRKDQSTNSKLYDTLSTEAGNEKIVITGSEGKLALTITDTESSAYVFSSGYYDLEITDLSAHITRILQGVFSVNKNVTAN